VKGKDINWKQGLFILPQHFQQAFLNQDSARVELLRDFVPYFEGVIRLDISESSIERFTFEIDRIDCRMPDGTHILYSNDAESVRNAEISSRTFKAELLDKDNKGSLDIYLGLPDLRHDGNIATGASSHRRRYLLQDDDVADMVSGEKKQIETRVLRPEILLSTDSRTGYSLIPIARVIHRSGEIGDTARLDPDFLPPCISIYGSSKLHEIFKETGNRLLNKNELLRDFWKRKDVAKVMRSEDTFKVQTVAVACKTYQQLATLGHKLHPFQLYLKMAEIIGMLSIYTEDDELLKVPDYDHYDLGTCFSFVNHAIKEILAALDQLPYHKVTFKLEGETYNCPFNAEWFEGNYDIYICFESQLDEIEVARAVRRLKVAPQNKLAELNKLRLRGIGLDGPRHQLSQLPASPKHHYFRIPKDDEVYEFLPESWVLSIWGDVEFSQNHTLYVVKDKG
jgi:type VI secretion system protein ImpJ